MLLEIDDDRVYNSYSIKDQELFQQDAVPPVQQTDSSSPDKTSAPPLSSVPVHKRIPKIALNFTKWKLQQNMVTDLKEMTDQAEITKKI